MFGDQWICKCGTRNIFLRGKCRDCGRTEAKGKIADETAFQVMSNVHRIRSTDEDGGD